MEEKLTKQDMRFMTILHIIWQMANNYADTLSIKVPSDPTKVKTKIYYEDNITHIRCKFKKKDTQEESSFVSDAFLNESIQFDMQGHYERIDPDNENEDTEFMEALFINGLHESGKNNDKIELDIIYIDNDKAYRYVSGVQDMRMELLSED